MDERLKPPIILVNFKCYLESTGSRAISLAKAAEKAAEETGVAIVIAPQYQDISWVAKEVRIPIFSQHLDSIRPGAYTGHILPESIKEAGAVGAILNHSERRLVLSEIEAGVVRAKEVGLLTCVCANTSTVSAAVAALEPDMVAIEPPELIGSGVAVSKAKPEVITDTVERIRRVNRSVKILCGAGISSGVDASAAVKLGSEGFILSSWVVKAKNQYEAILELANAVKLRQ